MDVLIALIISVAIFFTVSYVASIIIEYKRYEAFIKNGEIQEAIKKAVAKAEIIVENKEEEKKTTRKPRAKKETNE